MEAQTPTPTRFEDLAPATPPHDCAHPAPPAGLRGAEAPRLLLLAALFKLPYRVLRCAAETGAEVFVLGSAKARGLRQSRYCARFFDSPGRIDGGPDAELVLEINRLAKAFSIDLVAAADAPSTRSLIAISHALDTPCFPMPALAVFDLLNDKWRFTQLCREMGVLYPASWLFEDAGRLGAEARRGALPFPFIAKPLSQDSGAGCITVPDARRVRNLDQIGYSPIIVQKYIPGEDIGASIFCRDGRIETYLTHSYLGGVYTAFDLPEVYDRLSRIAAQHRLDGIYNFDMRLTADGEVFFLECNPRVYYKMTMSMLAGFDFLGQGLPWRRGATAPSLKDPVAIRLPKALLPRLVTPWRLDADARRVIRFHLADPAPFLRERLGLARGG